MNSFLETLFLEKEEEESKAKRVKLGGDESLTPMERALWLDLHHKYQQKELFKPIFALEPDGMDGPRAREVLVALLNAERVDVARVEQLNRDMMHLKQENSLLRDQLTRLEPIEKIMSEARSMQDLIFQQSTESRELQEKVRVLEQRLLQTSAQWAEHYRKEADAKLKRVEACHWEFLDQLNMMAGVSPDLRDKIIAYMEKTRLSLIN